MTFGPLRYCDWYGVTTSSYFVTIVVYFTPATVSGRVAIFCMNFDPAI